MDRKTLFSSLFAAIVVAGAVVKTTADPDLRGLFVRMVSRPIPPPVARENRPLPANWPQGLELTIDPSLVAPMHAWGTGESYWREDEPECGEVELVELSAVAESTDELVVRFRIGDWSCYQYFDVRLAQSPNAAPTVDADARWWIDIRPIKIDAEGRVEASDEPEVLSGVVGRVAVDSLDWTPDHDIAVKLALGCEFDASSTHWLWIEGGGTTMIRPPK
jgi:hypothetical protein